jgi:thiamine-monophosphate kinase
MEAPTPRVARWALALRGVATSAIDISDGLLGDLAHVLRASGVGAVIDTSLALPLMAAPLQGAQRLEYILAGGDDYELAFTAAPAQRAAVLQAAAQAGTVATCIGSIEAGPGIRLLDSQGQTLDARYASFDHFA